MIKNPPIDQYTLGFHRATSSALFYLIYYVSSLQSCLKSNSIQYADTLTCTYEIPSEILNLQYQSSKLTLKILIHDAKLLGITFYCNLTWNEQINIITKSTYGVLRVLKSFKRFTPFTTRK